MKNQRFTRNIFGEMLTQKMAQVVLPELVRCAQNRKILLTQKIGEILNIPGPNSYTLQWIFSWIQTTLYELERNNWEYGEIPNITAIAVVEPEKPTNWMDKETRVNPNTPLPWDEYTTHHILPVFEYPHWDKVMDYVISKL